MYSTANPPPDEVTPKAFLQGVQSRHCEGSYWDEEAMLVCGCELIK
jgi:hypothetical protein